jgi:hypothetical protein
MLVSGGHNAAEPTTIFYKKRFCLLRRSDTPGDPYIITNVQQLQGMKL